MPKFEARGEEPIDLKRVRFLPQFGKRRPSYQTTWRWCVVGCRGVYLEAERIGGRIITSIQAVERFLARRGLRQENRRSR